MAKRPRQTIRIAGRRVRNKPTPRPIHSPLVETNPPALEADRELENALIDDPSPDRWAVLGDWLVARGDPRGEWIALEQAIAHAEPGTREADRLTANLQRLSAGLIEGWFGPIAQLGPALLDWEWAFGYLDSLTLGGSKEFEIKDPDLPGDLIEVLLSLVDHPSARLLRRLRIVALDPPARAGLGQVLARLAERPFPALRRLELGPASDEGSPHPGRASRDLWLPLGRLTPPLLDFVRVAPRLRELMVRGRVSSLPMLPTLDVLELCVPELGPALRESLIDPRWPPLRRLWLLGRDTWNGATNELAMVLGHQLEGGRLRDLALQGEAAIDVLLSHSHWPELTTLRLLDVPPTLANRLARDERIAGISQVEITPHPAWGTAHASRQAGRL